MSVHLEFKNGSKVNYDDVRTYGIDFNLGFVQNDVTRGPGIVDNGLVQDNNITLSGGDQVGNGFV